MTETSPAPPPEVFYFEALTAYWRHLTIRAVAELGIADYLKDGPLGVEEIAARAGAHAPTLYRVLRASANAGVFHEPEPRTFALTPVGELLRSDVPNSFRPMILAEMEMERVPAWHALPHSIRTGAVAYEHVNGHDIWHYYRQNPEAGATFASWMTQGTRVSNAAILAQFDFSPYKTVVDIGGGQGLFLSALLEKYPATQGVLFDQPEIVAIAPDVPRLSKVGGNFFESVPAGGDLYTLKWIIHDWEEHKALGILQNIRKAMKPGAQIMLLETILKEGPEPDFAKWMDINMLVIPGGQERTVEEYRTLLSKAGFRLDQVIPTESIATIMLASQA